MKNQKFALVTGASTGIGREIALTLSKENIQVGLVARRKEKLEETKRLIQNGGGKAIIFPADLSDINSINKLISKIKSAVKTVDIIVNVAGIWHGKEEVYASIDFEKFPQKVILDTFFVGLLAPSLLVHGLLPLIPQKGKIINISGTFENGAKGWLPYYVSKRAIEDLTIGLSQELKDKDIQINAISPSDTATEEYQKFFPQYINNCISPKEIAQQVLKLTKEDSSTGQIIVLKKSQKPFNGFHY